MGKIFLDKVKEVINKMSDYEIMPSEYRLSSNIQRHTTKMLIDALDSNVKTFEIKIKSIIEDKDFSEYELGNFVAGIFDKLTGLKKEI